MIMEGSWFQAIIVRGKKEKLKPSCDVDIGIYFHAWDPASGALRKCQPGSSNCGRPASQSLKRLPSG